MSSASSIKMCIGIDCSATEFVCRLGHMTSDELLKFGHTRVFANTVDGYAALYKWSHGLTRSCADVRYVVEVTGVYHQRVVSYLAYQGVHISVVAPDQARAFATGIGLITKTDAVDAKALAHMGLMRRYPAWQRPDSVWKRLRDFTRDYQEVGEAMTRSKNQLHAIMHSLDPDPVRIAILHQRIAHQKAERAELQKAMDAAMQDLPKEILKKLDHVLTIFGVGQTTTLIVIAETEGFAHASNSKQVVSYAGLDVKHHQSGAVAGRSTISKRGNTHIRSALYMAAMTASANRNDSEIKRWYQKLRIRKNKARVAHIAVMRKLLVLIYTIWKTEVDYKPNFEDERRKNQQDNCTFKSAKNS